jgi:predicted CoA-binding protein
MGEKPKRPDIKKILTDTSTIAVVGLSGDPEKDSHRVAEYMKKHGYRIVPVNPTIDKVLGEKSYKSLLEIPAEIQREIDLVDIFRRTEDVPPVVEQAVKLREMNGAPCVIWMQLGITNEEAAATARKAGFTVIMGRCIMQEHKRLFEKPKRSRRAAKTR